VIRQTWQLNQGSEISHSSHHRYVGTNFEISLKLSQVFLKVPQGGFISFPLICLRTEFTELDSFSTDLVAVTPQCVGLELLVAR
jgi:hypothetical protein